MSALDELALVMPSRGMRSGSGTGCPRRRRLHVSAGTGETTRAVSTNSPVLIVWGVDASANILCWDASGPVPEDWPVLVWRRGDHEWRRYQCGMAEFLRRTRRGELDANPFGDAALWRRQRVKFLSTEEENRLLDAGIDPWE